MPVKKRGNGVAAVSLAPRWQAKKHLAQVTPTQSAKLRAGYAAGSLRLLALQEPQQRLRVPAELKPRQPRAVRAEAARQRL